MKLIIYIPLTVFLTVLAYKMALLACDAINDFIYGTIKLPKDKL